MLFKENKKPCFHFGKQGLKVLFDLLYLLTSILSVLASGN